MKAFIGLLEKERIRYLSVGIIGLVFSLFAVWLGPILLHRYNSHFIVYNSRFFIVVAVVVLTALFSLFYFITSVKRDVKQKELWLHNRQSISTLIFAKFLYQGIQMIVICAVAFIGFFFVGEEIVGTFSQKIFFYGTCIYYVISAYLVFGLIALFFEIVRLQLRRLIKKGSTIITIIIIIVIIDILPDDFLPYWKISDESLRQIFPQFKNGTTAMFFDIYLAEELFTFVMYIVFYIVTCKWLERVLTR